MFRATHPSSGARLSVVAILLFVLSGLFAVVAAPAQAVPDTTPPSLVELSVTPTSVDTGSAAQTVNVDAHITDESGLTSSYGNYISYSAPGGAGYSVNFDAVQRISGSAQDGTYRIPLSLARWSEMGTWRITQVSLRDTANNSAYLSGSALSAPGFVTSFEQTATGDTAPPVLSQFGISPPTVNTEAAAQTITVTARITDDVSGVGTPPGFCCGSSSSVTINPPSAGSMYSSRSISIALDATKRISGDALNGVYQTTITVPRYSEQGIWRATIGTLSDVAGNRRNLSTNDFEAPGFSALFNQAGVGDTTAPAFASLTILPGTVDTSASAQTVTVTARITDPVSGLSVYGATLSFYSPGGSRQINAYLDGSRRIAGTAQDGTYQTTITVPRYSEQGVWRLGYPYSGSGGGPTVTLGDVAGNSRSIPVSDLADAGFSTTFTQNGPGDTTAPVLAGFGFTPGTIDTAAAARTITVTARITDDLSGLGNSTSCCGSGNTVTFRAPSTNRSVTATFDSSKRISGSAIDGVYQTSMVVPRYSEPGTWRVSSATFNDVAGNQRSLAAADLAAAGFPTSFVQTAAGDSTPPVLRSLTITPATVDASTSAQTVTLRARITDDLSGLSPYSPTIGFTSPALGQSTYSSSADGVRLVSGTAQDGVYDIDMIVPRFAEGGTWQLNPIQLTDALGNSQTLAAADVSTAGFPTTFTVAPAPPTTAPGSPSGVTASGGNGSVTLQWTAPTTNGGAAVTGYTVRTYAPPGTAIIQTTTVAAPATSTTIAGLANGSTYRFTVAAINAAGTGPAATSSDVVPRAASFNPTPIEDIPVVTTQVVSVPSVPKSGYWMVGADGNVYAFGDARSHGNAPTGSAVDLEPTPSGNGYWIVDDLGRVFAFGDAVARGNVDRAKLAVGEKATSLAATKSGGGYWIFTNRGRVLTFGDAPFLGDVSGLTLAGPVLDSIATPTGAGYYMVASDGGIFAFGDAKFYGSMGGQHLNAPVQSLVPDSDGVGYWLVASDGGVFAFEAGFRGSMGSSKLNRPVTGMVRSGTGYLMVGEDGGIFDFSGSPDGFKGSLGANPPANPIVSVAVLEK